MVAIECYSNFNIALFINIKTISINLKILDVDLFIIISVLFTSSKNG